MDITPIIVAIINPLFAFLSLVFTGFMTYLALKINKKVDEAKEVNDATHTLVNSNMGIQLKIAMGLTDKISKLTNTKEDLADAAEAKRLYEEHMKKQAVVDSREYQ
jgi:hypothetical protein